jgi:type 1 glutamine amidotransferase
MRTLLLGSLMLGLAFAPRTGLAGGQDQAKGETKIVLIAGKPSHGPGEHEFNAGITLLAKCLKEVPGINPVIVRGGWPEDESIFDDAATVVFFMDGGAGHPMITDNHMATMNQLMQAGVGLVCLHYAVEVPKGAPGDQLLEWLGGYYEQGYSTNPHNNIQVDVKAGHPITRGVKPFRANDEWYYMIRFRPNDPRVTPILTGEGFIGHDRKRHEGRETLAWATERRGGGRSFGFTGAHNHKNWGIPEFRKLVLNAILWTAHVEVPKDGVECHLTDEDLTKGLDPKPGK